MLNATHGMDVPLYGQVYRAASDLMTPATGTVNVADLFTDSTTEYVDWMHLSEEGNGAMAARLYKDIRPLVAATAPGN